MMLTKVVRQYIIASLLCHKSTKYDDTFRAFSFHNTCEANIDESAPVRYRVHRSVKEALKRFYPWPGYYFKNRKGCCYPPAESCIDYRELSLVLPKKAAFVYIAVSNEEK